jgi:hypothetical protein
MSDHDKPPTKHSKPSPSLAPILIRPPRRTESMGMLVSSRRRTSTSSLRFPSSSSLPFPPYYLHPAPPTSSPSSLTQLPPPSPLTLNDKGRTTHQWEWDAHSTVLEQWLMLSKLSDARVLVSTWIDEGEWRVLERSSFRLLIPSLFFSRDGLLYHKCRKPA